jgi:hypothetical protein
MNVRDGQTHHFDRRSPASVYPNKQTLSKQTLSKQTLSGAVGMSQTRPGAEISDFQASCRRLVRPLPEDTFERLQCCPHP